MVGGVHTLRVVYVAAFSLAALGCFVAVGRTRARIDDEDTRWGLTALLATSGLWAAFHVGRLLVPSTAAKVAFYVLGLVVGLATVGAWLYFCSAYAGRSYHRERSLRWIAVATYAGIVAVKLTSPVHGLYFTTAVASTPFPHLVIRFGVVHWVVTGLAYALSAVGFYVLFDLFRGSHHATTRLRVLVALAGVPAVVDVLAYAAPDAVITFNYEPIGVGLFALGVLYFADGNFIAVRRFGRDQLLDELDDAVVLVDADGVVRDVNAAARRLYPGLADGVGRPLAAAAPAVADYLPVETPRIVTFDDDGGGRYYLLSTVDLTAGQTSLGRALVFNDVTAVERQRRQLARHRGQLDDFAEAVTHELRNTVGVVQGYLAVAEDGLDPDSDVDVAAAIATASETADRMTDIVTDLAMLARFGRPVEETAPVDVAAVAREAWTAVSGDHGTLSVSADGPIAADGPRLARLFENLFGFAVANGATRVAVDQRPGELVVTDDGAPLTPEEVDRALTYGEAVPDSESGMLLPVVRTLAQAHGWEVAVDDAYRDGVRVRIATSGPAE